LGLPYRLLLLPLPAPALLGPQYRKPDALVRYAELADMLGLGGASKEEKVVKLIEAVEDLKRQLDVPATIREVVGADKEELYMASTLEMSYQVRGGGAARVGRVSLEY
jgi:alcohol dehydrogenase class IV